MKVKDHFLTGEVFDVMDSEIPGILKTSPAPADLAKYYDSDHYISHHQDRGGVKEWLYKKLQKFNLNFKYNILSKRLPKNARVLDYGCGAGEFLKYIEDDFAALGFEPNMSAQRSAEAKTTKTSFVARFDDIPNNSLPAITLWHVLEHIENQSDIIRLFYDKLVTGGYLIIAVPNYESHDAKYYGEYWAAYDVPRHLYHFSQRGIKNIFKDPQWQLEEIRPLILDAFYISMLSSKYRKNPLFWFFGIIRGAISNFKASKTGEFSSLIYIIRKN